MNRNITCHTYINSIFSWPLKNLILYKLFMTPYLCHIYDSIVVSCLKLVKQELGAVITFYKLGDQITAWHWMEGSFHDIDMECHTNVIQVSYNIMWHKQQNYWTSSPVSILPFWALSEDFFLCFFLEKKNQKNQQLLCVRMHCPPCHDLPNLL